jgi:hypothetical protein
MTRKLNGEFCCPAFEKEYEKGHCCEDMVDYLHDPSIPIKYDAPTRRYYVKVRGGTHRTISFCPACGKKLPEVLRDQYYEILKKEYGLNFADYKKFPKEFKSDAWWKKRNL